MDLPPKKRKLVPDVAIADAQAAGQHAANQVAALPNAAQDAANQAQDAGQEANVAAQEANAAQDAAQEDQEANMAQEANAAVQEAAEALQAAIGQPPCRFRSVRHTCALVGCYLKILPGSNHCCLDHYHKATAFSTQTRAFHCFGGFRDFKATCCICLFHKVLNVETRVSNLDGVQLENRTIFSESPWDLPHIFSTEGDYSNFPGSSELNCMMNKVKFQTLGI
ncbi:hypothetical protein Bca4012_092208 [Brassica carinata]